MKLIYQYRHIRSKAKNIKMNAESYVIIMNWSIHKENIAVLNIYGPNNRASKYRRQNVLEQQGGRNKSTIILEIFIVTFYTIDGANRRSSWLE